MQGRALLNFVFNVGLPILIFGALTGVPLAREHALLPVAAICISLVGLGRGGLRGAALRTAEDRRGRDGAVRHVASTTP